MATAQKQASKDKQQTETKVFLQPLAGFAIGLMIPYFLDYKKTTTYLGFAVAFTAIGIFIANKKAEAWLNEGGTINK